MSELRISQVMLTAGFGGAERLFVDLCQALAGEGPRIQAVCHPLFQGKSLLSHPRIKIAPLKARLDWSPWSRYRLRQIFADFNPRVVHVHSARSAIIAGDSANRLRIPVIANLHDYVKLKYYRQTSHFCPGTEDLRQYLIGQGVDPQRITVIPHFTSLPAIEAVPAANQPLPILLAYGRFEYIKGFHVLIESVAQLKQQGTAVQLLLGGDGPESKNLRKLIIARGLTDQITLVGWVDNVVDFLTRGSIFVLPSLRESFGIALLEAMARGKTIIASKTPGPSEILDDTNAYLVEINDPESLTRALNTALARPAEAAGKAANSLTRYHRHYTPLRITSRFLEVYRRMAGELATNHANQAP